MSNRRHRLIIAAAVGLASAAAVLFFVPAKDTPRVFLGGVDDIEIYGGTGAIYQAGSPGDARRAAATIRGRMPEWSVAVSDAQLQIGIPHARPESARNILRRVVRGGDLTFRRVESETDFARDLFVTADEHENIGSDTDLWTADATGKRFRDYYVWTQGCLELEGFVAQTGLSPQPGHRVVFEEFTPADGDRARRCRTYVVSEAVITGADIDSARVIWDQYTARPAVLVSMTDDGASKFGDFTRDNVGKKLAIVVGDRVESAPVIQSGIDGGQVQISLGWGPPRELEAEAEALTQTLGLLPIEGQLRFVDLFEVPPQLARNNLDGGRLMFATAAGIGVFSLVLLLLWLLPPARKQPEPGSGPAPWGALAVTLGGFVLVWLSGKVPVPTIDTEQMQSMFGMLGDERGPGLFALGITPILTAFVLVELVAAAVPRWRPLRTSGHAGRARLARAVAVLAMIFALLQGYLLAVSYDSLGAPMLSSSMLVGPIPVVTTALSLAAGPLIYVLIAMAITRWGLLNGFSAIIGFGGAIELFDWAELLSAGSVTGGDATPLALGVVVVALILTVLGTWRFLRARSEKGGVSFRLPTCGIIPLGDSAAILSVLLTLASLGLILPESLVDVLRPTTNFAFGLDLVLVVIFGIVYSWLFSRPKPLASGVARVADRSELSRQFARAAAASVGFVAALWLVRAVMVKSVPLAMFDIITVALAIAIWLDVVDEWRARRRAADLVEVWPIHRMPAVDVVAGALRTEGIEVHTRGVHHRSLLLFFAPYVPVAIMVPRADAARAREVAASTLGVAL